MYKVQEWETMLTSVDTLQDDSTFVILFLFKVAKQKVIHLASNLV